MSSRVLCCTPGEGEGMAVQAVPAAPAAGPSLAAPLPSKEPTHGPTTPLPSSKPTPSPTPSPTLLPTKKPTPLPTPPSLDQTYQAADELFLPMAYDRQAGWTGTTYHEAIVFCAREEGYHICPFNALCPMGPGGEPVTGHYESDAGAQWVPVSEAPDAWVSLSSENACAPHTIDSAETPAWGLTVEEREAFTQHIVCCKGSILDGAEESSVFRDNFFKHHPVWFSADEGWTGRTHTEAIDFCAEEQNMSLCPLEAYCPMADLDHPFGGVMDEPGGCWAPVGDLPNMWVSIGPEHTCQIYGIAFGKRADWGITGADNEEMSNRVLCCGPEQEEPFATLLPSKNPTLLPTPLPSSKPTQSPTPQPTNKPTPLPTRLPSSKPTQSPRPQPTTKPTPLRTRLPSSKPTPAPTPLPTNNPTPRPSTRHTLPPLTGALGTSLGGYDTADSDEKYSPVWYDRSSGWTGQTFDEAALFCSGKGLNNDICPYEAICPEGPRNPPYGGIKDEPSWAWAPINGPFNSWVQVSNWQSCTEYKDLNPNDSPSWGLTGADNEDLTRHVACCEMDDAEEFESPSTGVYGDVVEKYAPKWFTRDDGWTGRSYNNAIAFCASQDSFIPCPYEAYCPKGEGTSPTGHDDKEVAWAAIMDIPNGWVQIGYEKNSISNSCVQYNVLHDTPPWWGLSGQFDTDVMPQIMCCKEPSDGVINEHASSDGITSLLSVATAQTDAEQKILEEMNPVWFGRRHGYYGTTLDEAVGFCKNIGDMVLCPRTAYCPGTMLGARNALFLQKDPFEGEQWAPAASEFGTGREYWISVGNQDASATCATHEDLQLTQPDWVLDGSQEELKDHVLCCQNHKYLSKELSSKKDLNPIWMDSSHGWNGGSHGDANQFCESFGNRKLCPYTIYCPHGQGQPVMGGHATDFNTEGEQWAPVYGESNRWVMIGQKFQNRATTCMTRKPEGDDSDWDMSKRNAGLKNHILCCSL